MCLSCVIRACSLLFKTAIKSQFSYSQEYYVTIAVYNNFSSVFSASLLPDGFQYFVRSSANASCAFFLFFLRPFSFVSGGGDVSCSISLFLRPFLFVSGGGDVSCSISLFLWLFSGGGDLFSDLSGGDLLRGDLRKLLRCGSMKGEVARIRRRSKCEIVRSLGQVYTYGVVSVLGDYSE